VEDSYPHRSYESLPVGESKAPREGKYKQQIIFLQMAI